MIPGWIAKYVIKKPLGVIPDFLKGFWNSYKGKDERIN